MRVDVVKASTVTSQRPNPVHGGGAASPSDRQRQHVVEDDGAGDPRHERAGAPGQEHDTARQQHRIGQGEPASAPAPVARRGGHREEEEREDSGEEPEQEDGVSEQHENDACYPSSTSPHPNQGESRCPSEPPLRRQPPPSSPWPRWWPAGRQSPAPRTVAPPCWHGPPRRSSTPTMSRRRATRCGITPPASPRHSARRSS